MCIIQQKCFCLCYLHFMAQYVKIDILVLMSRNEKPSSFKKEMVQISYKTVYYAGQI